MTTNIEHRQVRANGITFHVAVSGRARWAAGAVPPRIPRGVDELATR